MRVTIEHADMCIEALPGYYAAYRAKASALAHLGLQEEAQRTYRAILDLDESENPELVRIRSGYVDRPGPRRYIDGLLMAASGPLEPQ